MPRRSWLSAFVPLFMMRMAHLTCPSVRNAYGSRDFSANRLESVQIVDYYNIMDASLFSRLYSVCFVSTCDDGDGVGGIFLASFDLTPAAP